MNRQCLTIWLERFCLLRQLSGFESRHRSKIHNERHKQRSGQHTLARKKGVVGTKKMTCVAILLYYSFMAWTKERQQWACLRSGYCEYRGERTILPRLKMLSSSMLSKLPRCCLTTEGSFYFNHKVSEVLMYFFIIVMVKCLQEF